MKNKRRIVIDKGNIAMMQRGGDDLGRVAKKARSAS
jgi:hypothetical protein